MENIDTTIRSILEKYKQFTVYGLSPDSSKPSHEIPMFMKSKGYEPVGIYPKLENVGGIKIYPALKDVPTNYRKMVDVFRKPESIPAIVDEIIDCGGVEVLWLQLGITHPEAEEKAKAAGITVISNRCLLVEYKRLIKK